MAFVPVASPLFGTRIKLYDPETLEADAFAMVIVPDPRCGLSSLGRLLQAIDAAAPPASGVYLTQTMGTEYEPGASEASGNVMTIELPLRQSIALIKVPAALGDADMSVAETV